jgi:hypothetical protein
VKFILTTSILLFTINFNFSKALAGETICTFTPSSTTGQLAEEGNPPTQLASSGTDFAGEILVNCQSAAKLAISKPVPTKVPGVFNPITSFATVENQANNETINSDNIDAYINLKAGANQLKINIFVNNGSPLMAGTHTFRVDLNLIP